MRIAVNARVLQKGRMEGVARYIYEVTKRMVLDHPEDDFILLFDRPFDTEFIFADNVTAVRIGIPARHPQLFKLWFEYSVTKALKKYKVDVFFSGDAYLSLRSSIPSVMVSHDLAFTHYPEHLPRHHLKYYQKYFPRFHKKASKIIAVSEATKRDIINQFGISADKIVVGHNATPDGFSIVSDSTKKNIQKRFSHGKPYFIYLGSLHPRKNIVKLIEAFDLFRSIHNTDHQLVIIGRPAWNYHVIKEAYERSDNNKAIHIYHDIKEEAKQILASAEALVYVSTFEGFGIPILEAFSSEVPVISSNRSSMPEVAGEAALLVDPDNIQHIADAMNDIIMSPELRTSLIQKGIERMLLFDWDRTSARIYEELKIASNQ